MTSLELEPFFIIGFMVFMAFWPMACFYIKDAYIEERQHHLDKAEIAQKAGDREGFSYHFDKFLKVKK